MSGAQRRGAVSIAALLVMLAAQDGAAQGSDLSRRLFAGGTAALNIDHSVSHSLESTGGALAAGLAFGVNFADRWSVQVEGEWPTSSQTTVEEYTYPFAQPHTMVTRWTYRTPTAAVLFGVHWRLPKRVDIAFQFGPSFQFQERDSQFQYLANGIVVSSDQTSTNYWRAGVSVGAETAVALSPRVALVAQVRVHIVLNLFEESDKVVRPAVGVRIRF